MKLRVAAVVLSGAVLAFPQRGPSMRPVRLASRGTHGAVAAGTEYATEAGMRMFYQGGNAVDAGIATMLAASVTEFSHFGMGGEAPILVRTRDGKVYAIAGVGTMPKLATADFFRNHKLQADEMVSPPDAKGMKDWVPVAGILCALVPGMPEAALVALREFGTKSFAETVEPAIELADGFPIDELRSFAIANSAPYFEKWPSSKRVYMPNGRVPEPGEIFRQPDLARTLRSMVEVEKKALAAGATRAQAIDAVRDYFYRGEIARNIGDFSEHNGGLLRYEDMAAFHVAPEEPVSTTFHGYTVYKPGFWSQGPSMIEALNILEGFNLAGMRLNSADYIHTLVEALKLAYADRDTYYGDPKFNHIPAETLLSKEYGAERRKLIGPQASLEFRPGNDGDIRRSIRFSRISAHQDVDPVLLAKDTTCVDAIDQDGVAISITPSGAWMPPVIAGDTGIPLTQRAQSFLLIPGHPERAGAGQAAARDAEPDDRGGPGQEPDDALHAGRRSAGPGAAAGAVRHGCSAMNARVAVERPRFQSEHFVESFDNHEMKPGGLLLDERIGGRWWPN